MKLLFSLCFGVAALGAVLFLVSFANRMHLSEILSPQKEITVGTKVLRVDVANTEAARERGLSGRLSLTDGEGMLFVFEQAGAWGVWMKDMQFPIDIIWAGGDGTIVTIADDVATSTYPSGFYPTLPALYVLEVPAGFTKKNGIAEGDKIVVQ